MGDVWYIHKVKTLTYKSARAEKEVHISNTEEFHIDLDECSIFFTCEPLWRLFIWSITEQVIMHDFHRAYMTACTICSIWPCTGPSTIYGGLLPSAALCSLHSRSALSFNYLPANERWQVTEIHVSALTLITYDGAKRINRQLQRHEMR